MANAAPSQPQNFGLPFDPMEMWSKWTNDSLVRMQSLYDEMASIEGKAYDRAKATSEQLADLTSESITYFTKLADEWRKITLDATRRSAEAFKPKA